MKIYPDYVKIAFDVSLDQQSKGWKGRFEGLYRKFL